MSQAPRFRFLRWHAAVAFTSIILACTDKPVFTGESFDSDLPRPGPLNGYVVVTNNGDDTLSVVDPANRQVRWRIPVGFNPVELEGPHHIVADPAGKFFYINLSEAVAGSGSGPHGAHGTGTIPGFVLKISAVDGAQVAFAQVDPNPGDLTISSDGKTLYVTHYDLLKLSRAAQTGDMRQGDSNLAVVDTDTMTVKRMVPLCPVAHGVRISADGQTLYSSCVTDEIAIVQLSDPSLTARRVLLPASVETVNCRRCPYALSIAPDGRVWVSSLGPDGGTSGGGSVHIYDPQLGDFETGSILFCGRALFAAFEAAPQGSSRYQVYVPEQGTCGDWVRAYQAVAGQPPSPFGQLLFSTADCLNAHMLSTLGAGSGKLVCEGDHVGLGTLVFLDMTRMMMISSVQLGVFSDGMALIPTAGVQ